MAWPIAPFRLRLLDILKGHAEAFFNGAAAAGHMLGGETLGAVGIAFFDALDKGHVLLRRCIRRQGQHVCEIDLRPGGAYKFVSRSHPHMPFTGTYLEIAPPDLLVFEALGSTGRVQFQSAEGRTRMTVEIICGNAEQLEHFIQAGVDKGTSQTLDNLVAYMARQDLAA